MLCWCPSHDGWEEGLGAGAGADEDMDGSQLDIPRNILLAVSMVPCTSPTCNKKRDISGCSLRLPRDICRHVPHGARVRKGSAGRHMGSSAVPTLPRMRFSVSLFLPSSSMIPPPTLIVSSIVLLAEFSWSVPPRSLSVVCCMRSLWFCDLSKSSGLPDPAPDIKEFLLNFCSACPRSFVKLPRLSLYMRILLPSSRLVGSGMLRFAISMSARNCFADDSSPLILRSSDDALSGLLSY